MTAQMNMKIALNKSRRKIDFQKKYLLEKL